MLTVITQMKSITIKHSFICQILIDASKVTHLNYCLKNDYRISYFIIIVVPRDTFN
jgi:hypothetical protein